MNEFSLKEIYDVVLKANYPMDINATLFDEGDVIIKFDKLQLANCLGSRFCNRLSDGA